MVVGEKWKVVGGGRKRRDGEGEVEGGGKK